MKNENEKKEITFSKSFGIFLIIFAAIGLVGIVGAGVLLGIRIGENRSAQGIKKATTEVNEIILSDTSNEVTADSLTVNNEEEPINKTQINGDLSDVEVPEENASEVEEEAVIDDGKLRIVYLGDSIFDFNREDETSVPQLTSQKLDASCINLAIGGTCASIAMDESTFNETWNSTSGIGVAKAMKGEVSLDSLRDCTAKTLLRDCADEFSKTDIFVVEFGINDFLANRPISSFDTYSPVANYHEALLNIGSILRDVSPNASIILCKPTYCEFWGKDGLFLGNNYGMLNDYGTLFDYSGKVDCADDPDNKIYSFDPIVDNGINIYSAEECLEDGIHLTMAGREKYSTLLADFISRNILHTEEEQSTEEQPVE